MSAEALARVLCVVDGIDPDSESSPEPHDPADYAWEAYVVDAERILSALAPLIRAREAAAWDAGAEAAWDAGFDAGYQYARAVNPEWPDMPTNPFEGADDARD